MRGRRAVPESLPKPKKTSAIRAFGRGGNPQSAESSIAQRTGPAGRRQRPRRPQNRRHVQFERREFRTSTTWQRRIQSLRKEGSSVSEVPRRSFYETAGVVKVFVF